MNQTIKVSTIHLSVAKYKSIVRLYAVSSEPVLNKLVFYLDEMLGY